MNPIKEYKLLMQKGMYQVQKKKGDDYITIYRSRSARDAQKFVFELMFSVEYGEEIIEY